MADHRFGASIKLDGALVGLFLDGAHPEAPGDYGYMPMRAIGHRTMIVAVRSGQAPRCTWTHGERSVSFDVLAIPRHGVLSIAHPTVSDIGIPNAPGRLDTSPEPLPPWVLNPDTPYEAFWIECNDPYVRSMWLPFWDALNEEERAAYLVRFPPASSWQNFLQDVAFDQEVARIDAEDIASGVLQPNGSPWPKPEVARPPLWRRLLGRR